jgi:histidine triad (HIT) family protein
MTDCVFCKIIAGDIPSLRVYEDGHVIAFLDIQPVNPGHTLVVPLAHYRDLSETPDEVCRHLFPAVKKIARAVVEATGAHGYNVGINTGPAAGQVIFHTHVHVMPRFEGDGLRHWTKKAILPEEMQRIAADMKKIL